MAFFGRAAGHVLFDPFAISYKRFKERFVKVVIRPEATTFFFDRTGRSRFPLYWTSKPKDFKSWPRPTGSEEEVEILSFFDALPRKLPCRSLIGAYTETTRWAAIRGMGSSFVVSVGIFGFAVLTCVFWFAATMVNEKPAGVSVLDEYRKRATERKGRRSIDVLPANAPTAPVAEREQADPSHKSKKMARDGGNIATTYRSPGSLPTPPPSRREIVEVGSLSPRHVEQASGASAGGHRPPISALDLLGGSQKFTRRVRVTLPEGTRESIRSVGPMDLLKSGLELMCRSIVLVEQGIEGHGQHAEDASRLEQDLAEARENLKRSLATNEDLSASAAREAAKRELVEKDVAEARRLLALAKEEASRAAAEAVEVKKMAEEKLSSSAAELAALQAAKDQVEAELDRNYDESEELLKQCFDRAVRQAHFLYGGPPTLVNPMPSQPDQEIERSRPVKTWPGGRDPLET